MASTSENVFLLASQNLNSTVLDLLSQIKSSSLKHGTTILLFHDKSYNISREIYDVLHYRFNDSILTDLGYESLSKNLLPGSNHFSLLDFYLSNPNYKYYWYIEDDVRFNGNWAMIFEEFSLINSDFISCKLCRVDDNPSWFWWNFLDHPDVFIPLPERISSFNPIYRISNRALSFLDHCLKNGWFGHHEVLIPTLLYRGKFKIMDFGGSGEFVHQTHVNKFYIGDGLCPTMQYRPILKEMGDLKNKLYHPVKLYRE